MHILQKGVTAATIQTVDTATNTTKTILVQYNDLVNLKLIHLRLMTTILQASQIREYVTEKILQEYIGALFPD